VALRLLTLDIESFYSTEYSLSRMTNEEYVRDPRFETIMVGLKMEDRPALWIPKPQIPAVFARIPWSETAVLCHHAHFDIAILEWIYGIRPAFICDTLSMFRALYPAESHSLDNMTKVLGLPPKGHEVNNARGKRFADFTPEELARYGAYCVNDVERTKEAFDIMKPQVPVSELRLIDLTVCLFTEPVLELNEELLLEAYHDERQAVLELFLRVFPEMEAVARKAIEGEDPEAWKKLKAPLSSNPQFADMLLGLGIDPPKKLSPAAVKRGDADPESAGEAPVGLLPKVSKKEKEAFRAEHGYPHLCDVWAYAFGKSDEDFKQLLGHDDPAVVALVEARMGAKSTIKETRAKRFIGVSRRGTLPIYLKYYGAHCVPGHVGFLTLKGWQRLDKWDGGKIAQVHPNQYIEFLPARRYKGPVIEQWVSVDAPYIAECFTLGHTVPYLKHGSFAWGVLQAGELQKRASFFTPLAGSYTGTGKLTPPQMQVLCMVQADGHYAGGSLSIFVKKPRKIERARQLLAMAKVPFTEKVFPSHPDFVRFVIRSNDKPEWLTPERKMLGAWLLESTPAAREAFICEVKHWDGFEHNGQVFYSTSDEINKEWMITLCHLTNRCATAHKKISKNPNRRPNYTIAIRQRNFGLVLNRHISTIAEPQVSYCAETKTGFWLARSGERIFVTGNTGRYGAGDALNPQNLNKFCPNPQCEGGVLK